MSRDPRTLVQHPEHVKLAECNHPLVSPLHHSVKYYFDDYQSLVDLFGGKGNGFLYGRNANPTVRELEQLLASLQKTEDCIALGSGIAAIFGVLLALLKSHDHVLIFAESYAPSRSFVRNKLADFSVRHTMHSVGDPISEIEETIRANKSKIVFVESPTNPMVKLAPLRELAKVAHGHGALLMLDNTFAGPHQHHDLGIDIYVHSLTKFVVGFGDAMGGAICASKDLIKTIREKTIYLGAVMDPHVAYTCMRGLKTYFLRFDNQAANAESVCEFLTKSKKVSNLRYPGLKSSPYYNLCKEQMISPGSVCAFDVGQSREDMIRFLNALKMIKPTGSLGTTETLIAPCELFYAADLTPEERSRCDIKPNSVRLSVGIEACADIVSDLSQALGS